MSETEADYWYVAEAGRRYGPYTLDMVRERFQRGQFTKAALVWNRTLVIWQPITIHFRFDKIYEKHESHAADHERKNLKTAERRGPKWVGWLAISLTALACSLLFADFSGSQFEDSNVFLTARLATIGFIGAAGVVSAVLWWRYSEKSGLVRVATVIGVALLAVVLVVAVAMLPMLYRTHVARDSFDHYVVRTDVLNGALVIEGLIGPGLAAKVETQLISNTGIKMVTINSPGGLVDEALAVAHEIESQGNLAVFAHDTCNSACIIIFMSGKERKVPLSMSFGFHTTSGITKVTGVYQEALVELSNEADAFLISKGVPKSFLDEARSSGPDKLVSVSAIKMAEVGAVTNLMYGSKSVSIPRAKWLVILDAVEKYGNSQQLTALMKTIDKFLPEQSLGIGAKLWAKIEVEDYTNVFPELRQLISALVTKMLPLADDTAVVRTMRATYAELSYVASIERWDACASALEDKGFGSLQLPSRFAEMEFGAEASLIESAATRGWKKMKVPAQTAQVGTALVEMVAAEMLTRGENMTDFDANPKVACNWSLNLIGAILRRPSSEAASLYRWLVAGAQPALDQGQPTDANPFADLVPKSAAPKLPQVVTSTLQPGADRDKYIASFVQSCTEKQLSDKDNVRLGTPRHMIDRYCQCAASKTADIITTDDVKYANENESPSPEFQAKVDDIGSACIAEMQAPEQ